MRKIEETISAAELRDVAEEISEEEIINNLVTIIFLKRRLSDFEVRDIASQILSDLTSEKLANHFGELIELLRSPYALVRKDVEKLLEKIDPELIFDHFDYLKCLENDDEDYAVQRFSLEVMSQIMLAWPLEEKKAHLDLIIEWQKTNNEKKVKIADYLFLQIMNSWEVEKIEPFMPFLLARADFRKNNEETAELAVYLTFKFLTVANIALRLRYLDYMTSFGDYNVKEIRRGFRTQALITMKSISPKDYSRHVSFLLLCLEGKNKNDRRMAWENLTMINPDTLPLEQLINCQTSDRYRVRSAGKKLISRVSNKVLLENLDKILEWQDSNYLVRNLTRKLLEKIPLINLKEKKAVLEKFSQAKSSNQRDLALLLLNFC